MRRAIRLSWVKYCHTGIAALLLALGSAAASADSGIAGVWLTADNAEVTIAPCGEGYCGTLTKVVIPKRVMDKYAEEVQAMDGNYIDALNADPALRTRPLQGLKVLTLRPSHGPGRFEGEVYDATEGKTYSGALTVIDGSRVKLKGCALVVFCREQDWRRVR